MGQLQLAGTIAGGFVGQGVPVGDLTLIEQGGQTYLIATANDGISTARWTIGSGTPVYAGQAAQASGSHTLIIGSNLYTVTQANLDRFLDDTSSGGVGTLQITTGSGWVHAAAATRSGDYIVIADPTGSVNELTIFDISTNNPTLHATSDATDEADVLAQGAHGGANLLFSASESTGDVSAWLVNSNGTLSKSDVAPEGIGISQPKALATVDVGGKKFLVVGSSGSNSLTVLEVDPAGGLILRDHVHDSLDTRFGTIQQLEAVEHEGRSILLAAGTDGGLTALTMLPGGRLVVLDTIIDTVAIDLENIDHVTAMMNGDMLEIFVSSVASASLTNLRMDLSDLATPVIGTDAANSLAGTSADDMIAGAAGNDILSAGAGDDILYDGTGQDAMTGGSGSDLFVLSADGEADTITDFEVGVDRLDLSDWSFLYSSASIAQTKTATGVILEFRDEVLTLHSHNGQPIDISRWPSSYLLNIDRPVQGTFSAPDLTTGSNNGETLKGGTGINRIFGMGGDDVITGGPGADHLDGGAGNDIVDYSEVDEGIKVDLRSDAPSDGGALGDVLNNFEGVRGSAFDDEIDGSASDDALEGNAGADLIYGHAGADEIKGGSGDDQVWGGDGADWIEGGSSTDRLFGGRGNDYIAGGTGADHIEGGDGDDSIFGNTGIDTIDGGDGDDSISGGSGADMLAGGAGDDYLIGHGGWDVIEGGDGNDVLRGSTGRDLLYGGGGSDELHGGTSVDDLDGGDGNDILWGNQGADLLMGGAGDDLLNGGSSTDILQGGSGDDILYGNEGADTLFGGEDDDALFGGSGEDYLNGGSGQDRLLGNEGRDVLNGGAGNDVLRGGTGIDEFIYDFGSGRDLIEDLIAGYDVLSIDGRNWAGQLSVKQVISDFGAQVDDDFVLDFGGGNSLVLENNTAASLASSILIN